MRKKLLLAFLCLSAAFVKAQTFSSYDINIPDTAYASDISVVNSDVVWVAFREAYETRAVSLQHVARTTDGGATWTVVQARTSNAADTALNISNIHAINKDTAWIAAYSSQGKGKILVTRDGGVTWTQPVTSMYINNASFPNIVYFFDEMNGITAGDPIGTDMEIYTTSDGGENWIRVPAASLPNVTSSSEYGIVDLFTANGNHFWMPTIEGRVFHSPDRGLTWTVSATGFTGSAAANDQAIENIVFTDSLNGLVNKDKEIKITSDGGATWSDLFYSGTFFGSEMVEVPGTSGTVFSSSFTVANGVGLSVSYDLGFTWATVDTAINGQYYPDYMSLDFASGTSGWAGGFSDQFLPGVSGGAWKMNCPALSAPTVSLSGQTLTASSGYARYQWHKNGSPILGSTSATHNTFGSTGFYSVTGITNDNCSVESARFNADFTSVRVNHLVEVALYPNPASSQLTIDSPATVNVKIMNPLGQVIFTSIVSGKTTVDVSDFSKGIYLVEVSDGKSSAVSKVVVQ